MDEKFNMLPPKLHMYQLTKTNSAQIVPHISSELRNLGVNFEKSIISSCLKLADAHLFGTLDLLYGTQNKQTNTQSNVVERETRTLYK